MNIIEKLQTLRDELNAIVVEREDQVEGALAAILSGSHILFLGPPGTAKSLLANLICGSISDSKFFSWLMTKYTTPEEIFGMFSLRGMQADEYKRVTTDKLPEATISFLDEIFKPSSAILNTLLTIINERKFHNGGTLVNVPLISCFGASNELPESEELSALYDRFLLRYWVKPIQNDSNFLGLIRGDIGKDIPTVKLTRDEIVQLQQAVEKIQLSDDTLQTIVTIRADLLSRGLYASDRRWKAAIKVLQALALLRGNSEVTADELETLSDMLWQKPEDRTAILEVIAPHANPLNLKAVQYLDAVREVRDTWNRLQQEAVKNAGVKDNLDIQAIQSMKILRDISQQVQAECKDRPDNKTKKLMTVLDEIKKVQAPILKFQLG